MKNNNELNWREFEVTADEADELEEAYIVFEEDSPRGKNYDLCQGIFSNFDAAKRYAQLCHSNEDVFVAVYKDYVEGAYDYLVEVKK